MIRRTGRAADDQLPSSRRRLTPSRAAGVAAASSHPNVRVGQRNPNPRGVGAPATRRDDCLSSLGDELTNTCVRRTPGGTAHGQTATSARSSRRTPTPGPIAKSGESASSSWHRSRAGHGSPPRASSKPTRRRVTASQKTCRETPGGRAARPVAEGLSALMPSRESAPASASACLVVRSRTHAPSACAHVCAPSVLRCPRPPSPQLRGRAAPGCALIRH